MSKRKEELIAEARGKNLLTQHTTFISVEGIPFGCAVDIPDDKLKYDENEDRLFIHTKSDDYTVYQKGKWCTPVTQEEAVEKGREYFKAKHKGAPLEDMLKRIDTLIDGRKETSITITSTPLGIKVEIKGEKVTPAEHLGMLEIAKHSIISDCGGVAASEELTKK